MAAIISTRRIFILSLLFAAALAASINKRSVVAMPPTSESRSADPVQEASPVAAAPMMVEYNKEDEANPSPPAVRALDDKSTPEEAAPIVLQEQHSAVPEKIVLIDPLPCLGCYSAADINDETVKEMASFATTTVISQAINSPQPLAVSRIVSAKIQVVAGFNYDLELELQNGLNKDLIKCNVVVYDQSWTNTRRVTSCSCCGPSWTAAADHPEKPVVLPAALPAVELALPAAPDADAP